MSNQNNIYQHIGLQNICRNSGWEMHGQGDAWAEKCPGSRAGKCPSIIAYNLGLENAPRLSAWDLSGAGDILRSHSCSSIIVKPKGRPVISVAGMAPGVTLGGAMMVSEQVFGQLLCFVAMLGFLLVLAVFTRPY